MPRLRNTADPTSSSGYQIKNLSIYDDHVAEDAAIKYSKLLIAASEIPLAALNVIGLAPLIIDTTNNIISIDIEETNLDGYFSIILSDFSIDNTFCYDKDGNTLFVDNISTIEVVADTFVGNLIGDAASSSDGIVSVSGVSPLSLVLVDKTITGSVGQFSEFGPGIVPLSPGNFDRFLCADGLWKEVVTKGRLYFLAGC